MYSNVCNVVYGRHSIPIRRGTTLPETLFLPSFKKMFTRQVLPLLPAPSLDGHKNNYDFLYKYFTLSVSIDYIEELSVKSMVVLPTDGHAL